MTDVMMGPSSVALLEKEHRSLEEQIGELDAALEKRGLGWAMLGQATPAQVRALVTRFREDLMAHFLHEEGGLYSRVRGVLREGDEDQRLLQEFFTSEERYDLAAHRILTEQTTQMVSLLDELGRGVRRRAEAHARIRALVKQARHLLHRHAEAEDNYIFPLSEETLSRAEVR